MKDFLGKEITVGCTVVYPSRVGSSLWMTAAKVVEAAPRRLVVRQVKASGYHEAGKKLSTLIALERVVVVAP